MVFCIAMAALAAVRLALMAAMPVFEPSEARYAAISSNMSRTGDFLVPRFTYNGVYQPFAGKPPLVFQSGAAFCRVFGVCEFAVRLMPFLSFLLLLGILFCAVRRLYDGATAVLSVGICATCVAFYASSGVCMTDMPLSCCVSGSLLLYACHRARRSLVCTLLTGVLLGGGMMVKGPVAVMLFAIPVLIDAALNRKWDAVFDRRWIGAAAAFIAVAAPWFVLMERQTPGFMRYFFVNENILRFLVKDYGDKYGAGRETFRGMAAVWMLVVALPWSLVPLRDVFRRRWRVMDTRSFFFVSFTAITGFWCLTSRVPMPYLFPAVPMFAVWLATGLTGTRLLSWRLLPYAASASALVVFAVLLCGSLFTDKMRGPDSPRRIGKRYFAYEFYHGPWGRGCPQ